MAASMIKPHALCGVEGRARWPGIPRYSWGSSFFVVPRSHWLRQIFCPPDGASGRGFLLFFRSMIRTSTLLLVVAFCVSCRSQPTYLPNGDLAPATSKDYEKNGIYDVSFDAIKNNPSPELSGMNERDVDIQRNLSVNTNQSTRMFWSDLGRIWFADQPSPLSPYPTINTTGNP